MHLISSFLTVKPDSALVPTPPDLKARGVLADRMDPEVVASMRAAFARDQAETAYAEALQALDARLAEERPDPTDSAWWVGWRCGRAGDGLAKAPAEWTAEEVEAFTFGLGAGLEAWRADRDAGDEHDRLLDETPIEFQQFGDAEEIIAARLAAMDGWLLDDIREAEGRRVDIADLLNGGADRLGWVAD